MNPKLLSTPPSKDYVLLDSGEGEKLERFGEFVLRRPDPQAFYPKSLSAEEWEKADALFDARTGKGKWKLNRDIPQDWVTTFDDLSFSTTLGSFKHVGVFPEQYPNWQWLKETIKKGLETRSEVSVLNLFAYTGGATLACLSTGADVVHVDASNGIVDVAKKNAELSGFADKKVRWIADDVKKFVAREIKRGNKYHGIIMDPPAYGHGPKKETWEIEEDLLELIRDCEQILHPEALFFLISGYSAGYSAVSYAYNLEAIANKYKGEVEAGELSIQEEKGGRVLPAGIYARFRSKG